MDLEEINPISALMGIVGGAIGFIVAGQMESGIFIKIAAFLICGVGGYFVFNKIAQG